MITIQNNDGDRRGLLLDSPFALDESPDFPEYLFDVVFIVNNSVEETQTILNSITPITSTKCCYKPLFVTASLKGKMGSYDNIIDGYSDNWNDMEVLTTTENIINYNTLIGLAATEDPIMSSNQFFIRLTRYLISRKKTVLEPKLDVTASTFLCVPSVHDREGTFPGHQVRQQSLPLSQLPPLPPALHQDLSKVRAVIRADRRSHPPLPLRQRHTRAHLQLRWTVALPQVSQDSSPHWHGL